MKINSIPKPYKKWTATRTPSYETNLKCLIILLLFELRNFSGVIAKNKPYFLETLALKAIVVFGKQIYCELLVPGQKINKASKDQKYSERHRYKAIKSPLVILLSQRQTICDYF